jgi:hypothetical protein
MRVKIQKYEDKQQAIAFIFDSDEERKRIGKQILDIQDKEGERWFAWFSTILSDEQVADFMEEDVDFVRLNRQDPPHNQ